MACSKLTTSDLSKVRNEVFSAAAKWYDIGLELGVSADDLDTIKKANDDPKECLREMLRQWLSKVDLEPTWEALIAALRIPAVNYPALANEIKLKFCDAPTKSTETNQQPVTSPLNGVTDCDQTAQPGSATIEPMDMIDDSLGASTPKPRPVPKSHRSRSKSIDEPLKRELVQSFKGATSCEVTSDQIEKAEECIFKEIGAREERYSLIEFDKILNENQVSWQK